jgi:hypothetical protein
MTDIYNIIINSYYTFTQYSPNINMIIFGLIYFIKKQYINLPYSDILEKIKIVLISEGLETPSITDSEILEQLVNYEDLNEYNNEEEYEENYDETVENDLLQNIDDLNNLISNEDNLIDEYNISGITQNGYVSNTLTQTNNIQQNILPNNLVQLDNNFLNKKVNIVVDKNVLKKIRNRQYKFLSEKLKKINKICTICLDDFEKTCKVKVLSCNHCFHKDCITEWLTKETYTCPICRNEIGDESEHKIIDF